MTPLSASVVQSPSLSFGSRFKQWRKSKEITAYRLAKLTGVHPSFISNIEADRRPMSDSFMQKLCQITELELRYDTLQAWKAEAEYGRTVLQQAVGQVTLTHHADTQNGFETLPSELQRRVIWPLETPPPSKVVAIQLKSSFSALLPQDTLVYGTFKSHIEADRIYLIHTSEGCDIYGAQDDRTLISLTKPTKSLPTKALQQQTAVFEVVAIRSIW